MKRVMVIGQPGAGKSTFARRLGEITRLPVFHIDQIHWMPGWVERGAEEKTLLCREVHRQPKWILEGGHSATWEDRLTHADTLIWIDMGVARRMFRVLRRTLFGLGRTRPDLPANCPERFSWEFIAYIWKTRSSARQKITNLVEKAMPETTVYRLRTDREAAVLLSNFKEAMDAGSLGLPHRF